MDALMAADMPMGGTQRTADRAALVRHAAAGSDAISSSVCAGASVTHGGLFYVRAWRTLYGAV